MVSVTHSTVLLWQEQEDEERDNDRERLIKGFNAGQSPSIEPPNLHPILLIDPPHRQDVEVPRYRYRVCTIFSSRRVQKHDIASRKHLLPEDMEHSCEP